MDKRLSVNIHVNIHSDLFSICKLNFSLIKTITKEHAEFKNSKKTLDHYYGITTVKVNLTTKKKVFKIKNPGEILLRPIFLVTDKDGYYMSNWKIRYLCSTKPIKMGVKLICDMYKVNVADLDYENPPGSDVSLTL